MVTKEGLISRSGTLRSEKTLKRNLEKAKYHIENALSTGGMARMPYKYNKDKDLAESAARHLRQARTLLIKLTNRIDPTVL